MRRRLQERKAENSTSPLFSTLFGDRLLLAGILSEFCQSDSIRSDPGFANVLCGSTFFDNPKMSGRRLSTYLSTLTVSREAFSRITISRFPVSFSSNVLGIFRGLSNSFSSSAILHVTVDIEKARFPFG